MCDIGDLDLSEAVIVRDEIRRARISHRCSSCGAMILPGESYRTMFGSGDDGPWYEKACTACATALRAFETAHRGWVTPGGLDYVLEQCIDIEPETASTWQPHLDGIRQRNLEARVAR